MNFNISLLVGDGVGLQLVQAAADILSAIKLKYGHEFKFKHGEIGGVAIENTGVALPQDTIDDCKLSDATIVGAIGGQKYLDTFGVDQSRLSIQKLYTSLKMFATVVPFRYTKFFPTYSPFKDQIIKKDLDTTFVIESSSGAFNSDKGYKTNISQGMQAYDTTSITTSQIQRISTLAFDIAKVSNKKITLVDIADCSMSSILWRQTIKKMSALYPNVECKSILIDDFVPQFFTAPQNFDIVLSSAVLGKMLLSSISAMTAFNTLPKVVLGSKNKGIYGSYDYSIQDKAEPNPVGMIRAVALMFLYSFGLGVESNAIEQALLQVLKSNKPLALGGNCSCQKFCSQVCLKIINF